jgi:ferredoxin-NADP reductase
LILDEEKQKFNRIFFIAGGSGITPVYQTITEIAKIKN